MTISEEGGTNSSHTPQSGQILKSPRAEVAIEWHQIHDYR